MVKDSVANLIIKLKNAGMAKKQTTDVLSSKLNSAILALLLKEGFIKSFEAKGNKDIRQIEVALSYDEEGMSKISDVVRVSKLSKRTYSGAKALRPVRNGFGMFVLTTPKGILSDREARKQNVGGEVLFKIW